MQEDDSYEQDSDVRAQLKFFEQLDQLEKQRKEEQEREILLKAAKVQRAHHFWLDAQDDFVDRLHRFQFQV